MTLITSLTMPRTAMAVLMICGAGLALGGHLPRLLLLHLQILLQHRLPLLVLQLPTLLAREDVTCVDDRRGPDLAPGTVVDSAGLQIEVAANELVLVLLPQLRVLGLEAQRRQDRLAEQAIDVGPDVAAPKSLYGDGLCEDLEA